ncbi:MAG: hypothetical protein CM15mP84_02650 [Cellvibrionales bacterium]|nr:MAG: hypothetical protein CM15mP84_02650 [Cellvibrionales bacterium]
MNIRIKLFATLREALGESEFDLSLATLVPSESRWTLRLSKPFCRSVVLIGMRP